MLFNPSVISLHTNRCTQTLTTLADLLSQFYKEAIVAYYKWCTITRKSLTYTASFILFFFQYFKWKGLLSASSIKKNWIISSEIIFYWFRITIICHKWLYILFYSILFCLKIKISIRTLKFLSGHFYFCLDIFISVWKLKFQFEL